MTNLEQTFQRRYVSTLTDEQRFDAVRAVALQHRRGTIDVPAAALVLSMLGLAPVAVPRRLSKRCPTCPAKAGERCLTERGGPMRSTHPARRRITRGTP